ncbi:M36 family metallopeptidase [Salirhabdus salicampi]|uniref:M36 family metallopeptidase n=1 Tax=Salirhabdus salicampi TaxID=476102 RepID=UPI0020C3E1E7|nr:M36 family metallopeptidase [Salirhabdus salicampi]MCP8617730.1 M36 family metallopeptidase [Salirhabdus salicampi]
MKRKKKTLSVLSSALIVGQLLTISSSGAITLSGSVSNSSVEEEHTHLNSFDIRDSLQQILPTDVQLDAANQLVNSAGERTKITWNDRFGTPATIVKKDGYLTEATDGSAEEIAREWLEDHAAVFGLSSDNMKTLKMIRASKSEETGLTPVTFQQSFNGLESVFGGRIIVSVNKDGKILMVTSNVTRETTLSASFELTPDDALQEVLNLHAPELDYTPSISGEKNGWTVFDGSDVLPTDQYVKKASFIMKDSVRPAYRVLFIEELNEGYEVVIDGTTGEKLFERALVDFSHSESSLLESEGLIFENYPSVPYAPDGGEQVSKSFAGDEHASPHGWLIPGTELGFTTFGNNANSFANWSNFLVPADEAVRPVTATGDFDYLFTNAWMKKEGETLPPSYAEDVNSAATNLFYHHNLFHDYLYNLGWTEEAGNMQLSNYGNGGLEGDPILGLVQAGATTGGAPTYTGRDNAYMLTLPDGLTSWSGMFLWEPIPGVFEGKYADGDYDAGVIYHEYSHALTNRYVAGGEALNSFQSGAMGEGWGDFLGMHYLVKEGLQTDPVVGAYVTGNAERGIRNHALDKAPYNYGDIGYDITGPQVHADGGIWSAILWHVRESLIEAYGKSEGEEVIEHIVLDAMPISVPDPSMVDMRTAIVTAAFERYDGKYNDVIWKAFAQRGLGDGAYSNTGDDTDPVPSFAYEGDYNGFLRGEIVNATTGEPVDNARVIIGQYEARTSAAAVTSETGGFALPMVEGEYDVTIQAKGYGSTTLTEKVKIKAGKANSLKISLAPNVASSFNGATILQADDPSDSNPAKLAIDDTEASVYATEEKENGFNRTTFSVDLAGDEAVKVSRVQVSAFKDVANSRFATLKDFKIQISEDGSNWTTVVEDRFTYQKPRPAAPDLHYKTFDLKKPTKAKFIRLVANSTQDNSKGFVQVAELQAFTKNGAAVEPIDIPPSEPFTANGTVEIGNPGTGIGSLGGVPATLAVTENEFVTTQNPNPASQGADGYVVTLPQQYGDGLHNFTLKANDSSNDFDVFFYNKDFEVIGGVATASGNESGVVPGGTKYIYVGLWSGANGAFDLTVTRSY